MIKEMFFIRAIACISVVMIHAITLTYSDFNLNVNPELSLQYKALASSQMLLMFATPMFIFISEVIIANRYKDNMPKGFMSKRVKYILIPFIMMAIFYSLESSLRNNMDLRETFLIILDKITGNYHGYFILIIFQFYILHFIFTKYIINKYNYKQIIITSLLVNVFYLSLFNFITPEDLFKNPNEKIIFIWNYMWKFPFLAWIFYFSIAFYIGRNIDKFKKMLIKYKWLTITSPFITGMFVLVMSQSGVLTSTLHSRRFDILFYTICVAFVLFYISSQMKDIPRFFVLISRYSFGIYLLHPFFQRLIQKVIFSEFSYVNLIFNLCIYFIIGVVAPLVITYILNKTKFGPYLVGKIGVDLRTNKKEKNIRTSYI